MSKKAKKEYYKANFNLIKHLRQNQPFSKKKNRAKKEYYKIKPNNIKHLHYSFFRRLLYKKEYWKITKTTPLITKHNQKARHLT